MHQPAGQRYAEDLEGQNDEHLEGLSLKVKQLKEVSIQWPELCSEIVSDEGIDNQRNWQYYTRVNSTA